MSVRPAQKITVCNPAGLLPNSGGLLVTDEICVDVGGRVMTEATRYRLLDPVTLATQNERLVDILTGQVVTGTPVACPCAGAAGGGVGPVTNALAYAKGFLTSTVNGVATTIDPRGHLVTDAFGAPQGYLLPL